jgi:hypothetical protein
MENPSAQSEKALLAFWNGKNCINVRCLAYSQATQRIFSEPSRVAHVLGQKNIKNTQIYMHLADFRSEEEYHSAVATTIDETRKFIKSGFHFVYDMDGAKLFSKRK